MSNQVTPTFPWYDSPWLQAYVEAKAIIRRECPDKLAEFESAMERLPEASCSQRSFATWGWLRKSLQLLPWLQSTMT